MDEISKIFDEEFNKWFDTLDDGLKSFALMCIAVSLAHAMFKAECQVLKEKKEKKK